MKSFLFCSVLFLTACSANLQKVNQYVLTNTQRHAMHLFEEAESEIYFLAYKNNLNGKNSSFLNEKTLELTNQCSEIDQLLLASLKLIEIEKWKVLKAASAEQSIQDSSDPKKSIQMSTIDFSSIRSTSTISFLGCDSEVGAKLRSEWAEARRRLFYYLCADELGNSKSKWIQDPNIQVFESQQALRKQLKNCIVGKVNHQHEALLMDVYGLLSHSSTEWQSLLKDELDWSEAMNLLLNLETDLFEVRLMMLKHISSQLNHCCYGFTELVVMTPGPETAQPNEEIMFDVYFGAFDEWNTPKVTSSEGKVVKSEKGVNTVLVKVPEKGELEISGTIYVINKAGIGKEYPWKKKITIREK